LAQPVFYVGGPPFIPALHLQTFRLVTEWFASQEVDTSEEAEGEADAARIGEKYTKIQLRIVRQTMDLTLHNLRQSLSDDSYINLSPFYQRRHRWDIKKRSLLIESFLVNIPIPPVFLFENKYNQYEVMDGRQRLETIRDYLQNNFALSGLEIWKELNGRKFEKLPQVIQSGLLRRTLPAVVLLAETTGPAESEFDVRMALFRRLNTGGIQLNPQELRNALYPGHFNEMLRRFSRMRLFTTIWGIPPRTRDEETAPSKKLINNTLYKTMADCELVLRFFAIRETIQQELKGSLKKLLDDCMIRHQHDSKSAALAHGKQYLALLGSLYQTFDERPFLLPTTNKPSRPLYDALMVALSLHLDFDPATKAKQIAKRLEDNLNDKDSYDILVGRGNTVEAIKERVRLAEKILLG
jgi:hypothetical protein